MVQALVVSKVGGPPGEQEIHGEKAVHRTPGRAGDPPRRPPLHEEVSMNKPQLKMHTLRTSVGPEIRQKAQEITSSERSRESQEDHGGTS